MTPDAPYRSALPHATWPPFPTPSAANKLALLFHLEQNQWRDAEQIRASQFEQVRQVLAFASETVPHYRQQLARRFSPQDLTPESWQEIPILSRKVVHAAGASLRSESVPREHGSAFPVRSTGSTGMVVEIQGTELTSLYWQVFCLRDHLWHQRDLRTKLMAIRDLRNPEDKSLNGISAAGWGQASDDVFTTGPAVAYDIQLDLAHLAERLSAERPGYLLSHPSMIKALARHSQEKGLQAPGLKGVRTLGERCDESLADLCLSVWNAPLVDMYSCQEAGYLALQCPEHWHFHVQSENILLEVVDEQGRPCQPGQIGRVLITTLHNFATPLIRYEIGDLAEVGPPCPCGRGLPVLRRILGRQRNLVTLPDGSRHWPILWAYENLIQEIAPIELMQMTQVSINEIVVRLVMPRPLSTSEQTALTAFIHENLKHPFCLCFEYVDSIRNPANGKFEQFISLIP